jgi:hypothetical protein
MFNIFNKKPKIKFLCLKESVLELHPVTEARFKKPKWFSEEAKEYSERKKAPITSYDQYMQNNRSIAKCVGIRDLYKTGWVLSSWQDIVINKVDAHMFYWNTPVNQKNENDFLQDYVSSHDSKTFEKCPHLAKKTPILKIQSPWVAVIPKGYSLLQMPVAYQDNDLFETAPGIFSHEWGMMGLNVQLFLLKDGVSVIPAGTPLAHYVLVENNAPSTEVRYIKKEELDFFKGQVSIVSSCVNRTYRELKKALATYQTKRKM